MSLIANTIVSGFSTLTGGIGDIIGKLVKDPNESARLSSELTRLTMQTENDMKVKVEESYQQELKAKQAIITSELTQEDKFTKRVRPTILYSGLVIIFIDFVLRWGSSMFGFSPPAISIPPFFMEIWAGMCSVYIISRTVEKTGHGNKFIKKITG